MTSLDKGALFKYYIFTNNVWEMKGIQYVIRKTKYRIIGMVLVRLRTNNRSYFKLFIMLAGISHIKSFKNVY